ncbi:MAG: hypothetical protein IKQ82_05830 [Lentisphaeria bacterium]|nr:hypothetical protein [Lentisphaeria bacterium]
MTSLPKLLTLAAALFTLLTTACTTIRELPSDPADLELSSEAAEERDYSRKLLEAFLKNDASGFIALLSPEMKEEFGKDKFELSRKVITETLGEPVSFSYVTALEHVAITPYIWKVRFVLKNKENKEYYSEALFRVLAGHDTKGDVIVVGFNFL